MKPLESWWKAHNVTKSRLCFFFVLCKLCYQWCNICLNTYFICTCRYVADVDAELPAEFLEQRAVWHDGGGRERRRRLVSGRGGRRSLSPGRLVSPVHGGVASRRSRLPSPPPQHGRAVRESIAARQPPPHARGAV